MNSIRLRQGNELDVRRAQGLIEARAKGANTDLAVTIETWEDSLTDPQRRMTFKLLDLLAASATDNHGRSHARETWRSMLLIRFGYIAEIAPGMTAGGKWEDIVYPKSLSAGARGKYRMTKREMSDFYTQLEVFAGERGVWLEAA